MQKIKVRSIKINFILNTLRLIVNLLLPFITFPYISRVLGPESIGKVEFANSIVSYFSMFAALGIPVYGVREIARIRDDDSKLSNTIAELTIITSFMVVICYIFYFSLLYFVGKFKEQSLLFLIVSPNILLTAFNYEWFYKGIEDQLYITIRYLIMKVIQVISIFLFIHDSTQYIIYAAIYVGLNGITTIFYIFRMRRYVSFSLVKKINIIKHIKPILLIFSSVLAINIYLHLDVTMVGFFVNDFAVGLYTTANRIIRIIITVVTSLGTVMIPRLANNYENKMMDVYKKNLSKSINFILFMACPCTLGLIPIAEEFIVLFAGNQYKEAAFSMQLLSPIIIIVGLSNFVGLQILYTNKKEKYYTIAVSIAALVNFISNLIFIPIFKQNGAILGTILAEFVGLFIMSVLGFKYIKEADVFDIKLLGYVISAVIMFIVMLVCKKSFNFIIVFFIALLTYLIFVFLWFLMFNKNIFVMILTLRNKEKK